MNKQKDRHPNLSGRRWHLLFFMLLLTACSASPTITSSPTRPAATPPPTATVGAAAATSGACHPTTVASNKATGFPEAQGKAAGGQLWALFFFDPTAVHAKQELKIVWRMTGSGAFHIIGRLEGGKPVKPIWGPEGHGGSNWDRPGYEWGTGFSFPAPGCWNLHATRNDVTGDIWLLVQR
jgi:hypothetical protein